MPDDFRDPNQWWVGQVLYQVYPRSYMDTDGDGVGDLRGVIERLDHLASLDTVVHDGVSLDGWVLTHGGISCCCPRLVALRDMVRAATLPMAPRLEGPHCSAAAVRCRTTRPRPRRRQLGSATA